MTSLAEATGRLFNSLSQVAVGLPVGYEKWLPINCDRPLVIVIGWSKYNLGNASDAMNSGPMWPVWISTVFQRPLHSPRHIGMCKETVKESSATGVMKHYYMCVISVGMWLWCGKAVALFKQMGRCHEKKLPRTFFLCNIHVTMAVR